MRACMAWRDANSIRLHACVCVPTLQCTRISYYRSVCWDTLACTHTQDTRARTRAHTHTQTYTRARTRTHTRARARARARARTAGRRDHRHVCQRPLPAQLQHMRPARAVRTRTAAAAQHALRRTHARARARTGTRSTRLTKVLGARAPPRVGRRVRAPSCDADRPTAQGRA